tara:strand:- start:290 stop:634 length:345 start_codon:yes stop_codon:yes gene_type:complete
MANKYKLNITPVATTSITTVYTCPAENVAIVKSISAYNTHASSAADWILKVYNNSASAAFVYKGAASVTAASKKEFLEGDESTLLVLEESDALHFSTTITSANVFVSVLEQDRT